MSPEQRRGRATRLRALAAALDVYAEHGTEGFTVHAVSARGGVSVGSLYHHFGSVDGLAAAVYAWCLTRLLDAVVEAVERAASARAGIHAVVVAYLRFTHDEPAAARFVHASSYASFLPAHAPAVAAAKAPYMDRLMTWMRPHVAGGRIVDLPEPLLETLIVGPPAETARRWLAGAHDIDLREAIEHLPERVWRSVRAG